MTDRNAINTPSLAGWLIAAGAGLVAFGVSLVAIGLGAIASVAIGLVVALVVGLILGFPGASGPATPAQPAATATTPPAASAAPPVAPPPVPAAAVPPGPVPAVPVAPVASEMPVAPAVPVEKPATLAAARDGRPDDLKLIKGVGPKMEAMLHGMGFFHYDQIAAWTDRELAWVDENLDGFRGRASRDEWVPQARILAGATRA